MVNTPYPEVNILKLRCQLIMLIIPVGGIKGNQIITLSTNVPNNPMAKCSNHTWGLPKG